MERFDHQRRAQRQRHERPGAWGGDKGGQQPGREGTAPRRRAARNRETGDREQAEEIGGNRQRQQEQRGDHQRFLQLERPADLLARCAQQQDGAAQRRTGEHHPGGIGQRVPARSTRIAPGLGKRQRLEAEDGKDAGHDVEQQAARQRCQQQLPQRCVAAAFQRRHILERNIARLRGKAHAAAIAQIENARDSFRSRRAGSIDARRERPLLERDFGHQQVTLAAEGLRTGIDWPVVPAQFGGGEEQVRRAELRRGGDRNADPQAVAREFEARRAVERRDDGGAPFTEPRVGAGARGIQRHARLLRNADRIRTG